MQVLVQMQVMFIALSAFFQSGFSLFVALCRYILGTADVVSYCVISANRTVAEAWHARRHLTASISANIKCQDINYTSANCNHRVYLSFYFDGV